MKRGKQIMLFFITGIVITYPFTLTLISGCLKSDYGKLYTFNMSLNEFTTSWIAFWGLVCTMVGLYQIYEKLCISKIQHKELVMAQCKQFKTQIQNNYFERYYSCIEMLSSDDEIVRLSAIANLYLLARSDIYTETICCNFCDILCSDTKHSRKEKQRVIEYLFNKDCSIFEHIKKNINNCHLIDLYFVESNITNTSFNNTIIENCQIHNSKITNSYFIGSKFKNVSFKTTRIRHSNFRHSLFLGETKFNKLEADDVIFSEISCNDTMFNGKYLNKCDFSMAQIIQSRFSNIRFIECIFDFAEIKNTTLVFSKVEYLNSFRKMLPTKYENMIHVQGNILSLP